LYVKVIVVLVVVSKSEKSIAIVAKTMAMDFLDAEN